MDQQIQERLRVYEQEGLASPAIVAFVRSILLWLEQTANHPCTEETAGPFASHLMLALARVSRGEGLDGAWDSAVHEEAQTLTTLLSWAEYVQRQAYQVLELKLPPEEIDFILLHLGTFLLRYDDPRVASISK